MNNWLIWAFLVTAAVITLLVLVIVYMNKTSNIENTTINKYGPPNTYIGATDLQSQAKNLPLDVTTLDIPLIEFTVDKNWKAGTKALISGKVVYDFSDSSADYNVTYTVKCLQYSPPVGGGSLLISTITAPVQSTITTGLTVNLDMVSNTLNPGDVVKMYLNTYNASGSGSGDTATGTLVFNTYTPVAA
jgi:hypothetical protein